MTSCMWRCVCVHSLMCIKPVQWALKLSVSYKNSQGILSLFTCVSLFLDCQYTLVVNRRHQPQAGSPVHGSRSLPVFAHQISATREKMEVTARPTIHQLHQSMHYRPHQTADIAPSPSIITSLHHSFLHVSLHSPTSAPQHGPVPILCLLY